MQYSPLDYGVPRGVDPSNGNVGNFFFIYRIMDLAPPGKLEGDRWGGTEEVTTFQQDNFASTEGIQLPMGESN